LLDWHAQGNPVTGETRESNLRINGYLKYDARKEIAERALEVLTERYGKKGHVLFEAFCSPMAPFSRPYHGPSWEAWKDIAQNFVNLMRKHTSSIISINGTRWCQDLRGVLNNPIISKNIVYGVIIYYGTKEKYKEIVSKVKKKHPVFVVECGYKEDAREKFLRGDKKTYAYPLKKFLEGNKLGWFAWAYHPTREPVVLNSWNPDDLSEWGKFITEELL
jgi:hypothetical protein